MWPDYERQTFEGQAQWPAWPEAQGLPGRPGQGLGLAAGDWALQGRGGQRPRLLWCWGGAVPLADVGMAAVLGIKLVLNTSGPRTLWQPPELTQPLGWEVLAE